MIWTKTITINLNSKKIHGSYMDKYQMHLDIIHMVRNKQLDRKNTNIISNLIYACETSQHCINEFLNQTRSVFAQEF